MNGTNRRTFVKLAAASAVAPAVAGCTGGSGGNGNGDDGSGDDGNSDGGNGGGGGDVPGEIDDYLSAANEYDGSLDDHTGESEVTVEVGTGDNGFGFSPAAIRIDSGTTVVWQWTGAGGAHNVVDEDGGFESELQGDEGATFEYNFEEAGNYRYYCNPHRSNGMLGGIVVE